MTDDNVEWEVPCWKVTPFVWLGLKVKPSLMKRMLVKFILGWEYDARSSVRAKYYGLHIDTSKEDEINALELENSERMNKCPKPMGGMK